MSNYQPTSWSLLPPVVKNLLIINGILYLATYVLNARYGVDLSSVLGLHYLTAPDFHPYQIITYMFEHATFVHIFSNMFALWMFGYILENYWGPKRFLIYYFVCGIGGAFIQLGYSGYELHLMHEQVDAFMQHPDPGNFVQYFNKYNVGLDLSVKDSINGFVDSWNNNPQDYSMVLQAKSYVMQLYVATENIPTIGASGAIFGVLLAFGMLFPDTMIYLYFLIPVKAKYFVLFYALFEIYAGITGTEQGIAHFAHIGGMIFGFFLIRYWKRRPPGF